MNMMVNPDPAATAVTRKRYQRMAPLYDLMEALAERRYQPWRTQLWARIRGPKILEAGVGTGKNLLYYPRGIQITGIDLTPGMLERARKRAAELKLNVVLQLGDVQRLEFPDACFDSAMATFVFCSVADPVIGLSELARVVKPGGQVILLEHMRSANRVVGAMMDLLNPVVVRMMGANINRRTVENVQKSGLILEWVENMGMGGIFKLIEARVADPMK
jgi:phosphatidylethanolamine/phosphatidyl-N-methylethanolamine N-methyltransferase